MVSCGAPTGSFPDLLSGTFPSPDLLKRFFNSEEDKSESPGLVPGSDQRFPSCRFWPGWASGDGVGPLRGSPPWVPSVGPPGFQMGGGSRRTFLAQERAGPSSTGRRPVQAGLDALMIVCCDVSRGPSLLPADWTADVPWLAGAPQLLPLATILLAVVRLMMAGCSGGSAETTT